MEWVAIAVLIGAALCLIVWETRRTIQRSVRRFHDPPPQFNRPWAMGTLEDAIMRHPSSRMRMVGICNVCDRQLTLVRKSDDYSICADCFRASMEKS